MDDRNAGGSNYITHYSISGDETYYVEWDAYNAELKGVAEQTGDQDSLLETTRYWTNLKSSDPVLRYGDYAFKPLCWNGDQNNVATACFSFTRSYNGVTYWCITNFDIYDYAIGGLGIGAGQIVAATNGATNTTLPAGASIIVRL